MRRFLVPLAFACLAVALFLSVYRWTLASAFHVTTLLVMSVALYWIIRDWIEREGPLGGPPDDKPKAASAPPEQVTSKRNLFYCCCWLHRRCNLFTDYVRGIVAMVEDKVKEDRLRRVAKRRGFRIEKTRRRDPAATDYGTWTVYRLEDNTEHRQGLTLAEVETFLNALTG